MEYMAARKANKELLLCDQAKVSSLAKPDFSNENSNGRTHHVP